jgi:hypothetical protein
MDNQEDGDVDPYIHQGHWSTGVNTATPSKTTDDSGSGSATDDMTINNLWFDNLNEHGFKGFRRRGLSSETYHFFSGCLLFDYANNTTVFQENTGVVDQVATAVATTYVREPVWIVACNATQNSGVRMRKGTPRWLFLCMGGASNATFDSKSWIILSPTNPMFVAGPYDGATTPVF